VEIGGEALDQCVAKISQLRPEAVHQHQGGTGPVLHDVQAGVAYLYEPAQGRDRSLDAPEDEKGEQHQTATEHRKECKDCGHEQHWVQCIAVQITPRVPQDCAALYPKGQGLGSVPKRRQ
jgi:hypothetical protein